MVTLGIGRRESASASASVGIGHRLGCRLRLGHRRRLGVRFRFGVGSVRLGVGSPSGSIPIPMCQSGTLLAICKPWANSEVPITYVVGTPPLLTAPGIDRRLYHAGMDAAAIDRVCY